MTENAILAAGVDIKGGVLGQRPSPPGISTAQISAIQKIRKNPAQKTQMNYLILSKHTGGYRRIPYLAAVDTTHTRPVPAAHTPIAELYRAVWAIPIAGKLPGGNREEARR